jgi:Right handed beta helix region
VKALLATTAALAALSALPASALGADGCDRVASPGSDTAQRLLDSLLPGESGCLHGGTYGSSRDNVLYPRSGGEPGAPLTLRSYPGERARLVGIIDIPHGSDYITLSGLDIEGTAEDGANTIKIYSRGVVLEESDITNAWRGRSCLILGNNEGGGRAVAPIVRRNTFHECGNPENANQDHGIYAANVLDGEIVDNLFYNSAAYTVQLYPNAQRTRFAHNVVDGGGPSVRGGIVFGGDGRFASGDNVVERNVIVNAATAAITSYWEGPVGTGNLARSNCVWGSRDDDISREWGFTAVANRVVKPLFASRGARDYRLALGSQCLRTVGYDPLARRFGPLPVRKSIRTPLRIVARRPQVSASRVRLEFRLRGVRTGTARVMIRRHGRARVRTLRVRAKRRVFVRPHLRPGSYRAWAQVHDTARDRTAHSRRVRFRVSSPQRKL